MTRFHWLIVQEGQLPLRPDRRLTSVEHRPTVTLIWRENAEVKHDSAFFVDPFFTEHGFLTAQQVIYTLGVRFSDINRYFVTHQHVNHQLYIPLPTHSPSLQQLDEPPDGIRAVPCPGHAADLRALAFTSTRGECVWVVSDAVLDETWLRVWGYYHHSDYSTATIIQTWRSIALILAEADVIVPAHGAPIRVNRGLLETMISTFPRAEHYSECPDVLAALIKRLASFA